jgi:transcription factor SPN1
MRLPVRSSQSATQQASQAARDRALAAPVLGNRARVEGGIGTYTIAPRQNNNHAAGGNLGRAAPGRTGEEQFRRLKAKNAAGNARR